MTARVTPDDIIKAGYCMRGARRHCRELDIDLKRIIKEGLPVEELEGIDDVMVRRTVEVAEARAANG